MGNKEVAMIFGWIINLMHFLVLFCLYVLYTSMPNNIQMFQNIQMFGIHKFFICVGLFLIYILFAGFLCTIISIHEQLIKLNKKIDDPEGLGWWGKMKEEFKE